MEGSTVFPDHRDPVPDPELVQIDAVVVDDRRPVVHHPVARHHPRPAADVGHGGREIQAVGGVSCDADLNRAGPLGDHFVQADLEYLVRLEKPVCHNDSKVEVVNGVWPARSKVWP